MSGPSLPSRYRALLGARRPGRGVPSRALLPLAGVLLVALVSAGCQAFPSAKAASSSSSSTSSTQAGATTTTVAAPLVPLATSCKESQLPPHNGFEIAPACVSTDDGEVPAAAPAVMISDLPDRIVAGEQFQVGITTRNLLRDRFLKAAVGGYYFEMSVLDKATGVVRGHLHVYVQALNDGVDVPDADANPLEFFQAIEDGGGGPGLSRVTVSINALTAGNKRVCVTMGDGSHRVPMMRAAKLAAGVDCVRIRVR